MMDNCPSCNKGIELQDRTQDIWYCVFCRTWCDGSGKLLSQGTRNLVRETKEGKDNTEVVYYYDTNPVQGKQMFELLFEDTKLNTADMGRRFKETTGISWDNLAEKYRDAWRKAETELKDLIDKVGLDEFDAACSGFEGRVKKLFAYYESKKGEAQ